MFKKISFFILIIFIFSPCFVHAEEESNKIDKELFNIMYRGFKTVESFGHIGVHFENDEDAKKIGLKQDELVDFLRLRFKNNFGKIDYKETNPLKIKSEKEREKIGTLHCRVWVIGNDYPIAHHIKCFAGNYNNLQIWENEFLGYGKPSNVPDTVRNTLNKAVEDCAVVFFKARGEL